MANTNPVKENLIHFDKNDPKINRKGAPKGSQHRKTQIKELFKFLVHSNQDHLKKLGFGSASEFAKLAKAQGFDPILLKQFQIAFGTTQQIKRVNGEDKIIRMEINPDIQRKALENILDRIYGKPINTQVNADLTKKDVLNDIIDELSEEVNNEKDDKDTK